MQQVNAEGLVQNHSRSMTFKNLSSKEPLYSAVNKDVRRYHRKVKELAEEKQKLLNQIEEIVDQQKWREGNLHASLRLQVTELEADTRKKVHSLCERLEMAMRKNKLLYEQIGTLQSERKSLQTLCQQLQAKLEVSVTKKEYDASEKDHKMFMENCQKEHLEVVTQLQNQCDEHESSKACMVLQVQELQEKLAQLELQSTSLIQEKDEATAKCDEIKLMELNAQNLLSSLLKLAEDIVVERDILVNKKTFQEVQHKQLHSLMLGCSLNIGRLTEHVTIVGKKHFKEWVNSKRSAHSSVVEQLYAKHMESLREIILSQNKTIMKLEDESRILEQQLKRRILYPKETF